MLNFSRALSALRMGSETGVVSIGSDVSMLELGISSNEVDFPERLHNDRKRSAESVLLALGRMDSDGAMHYLQSSRQGLSHQEVSSRLEWAGQNILSTLRPPSWWMLLLGVLPNAFNLLLALLAIISVANPTPQWSTFAVLLAMIIISVAVRFWQEHRSNVAAIKLQESVSSTITVRRENISGKAFEATTETTETAEVKNLVPGDVVILSPGDSVPADCLILESVNLQISQSSLTGESEPVHKTSSVVAEKRDVNLFDAENVCFMGTSVISGSGAGLVVRTGDDAYIATIMRELKKKPPMNSFQRGTRNVSYMMLGFMGIMVPIVLVVSAQTTGSWSNAALFSISVAVGLVPEMLPAIVNGNLARGAFVLAKKKAIVKRLDAIQNLGGMSVLCSDKTGTLTKDEISLCHFIDPKGQSDPNVLKLAFTNAFNQSGKKNGIDSAIINHVDKDAELRGVALGEKVAEISFTFEKRRSSCIVREPTGKLILICKGAFEETSFLCTSIRQGQESTRITASMRHEFGQTAAAFNNDGYRVIAVAVKEIQEADLEDSDHLEDLDSNMTLEGFLTFLDPPKPDAAASIESLQNLGVDVKVLTGDNLGVALKVCRSLNLVREVDDDIVQAISGPDLAKLDPDEFSRVVKTCKVFAKLTPSQKAQVIMALRKGGECVGMLGDGINDCVALRTADAGISVDTGTSVAKDCADVILTQKELSIIVDCVLVGRLTHGNTIKYIKMVASSNFGNVFSVLIASAWLPYEPMLSLQILIQNLLYDISQIAIPWDRMDEEYLRTPKLWNAKDLLRFVLVLGPTSSTIDMCTFSLNWFYYGVRSAGSARVPMAHAHWFLRGLLTQTLIVHLLRTAKVPLFQRRAARVLVYSTVTIMCVGFAVPWIPPFQQALRLARPAGSFVGFLVAELLLYCVEVQLVKMVYIRLFKTWI